MKWILKNIKVSELKEWEKNPRILNEKGLADLKKSIKKFGLAEPLVCNTDFVICGGHGRKKVLEELEIEEVDCYFPEKKLSPKLFDELNIRLNANIAGEFDYDVLTSDWDKDELEDWGLDYDFSEEDFNNIKDNSERSVKEKNNEIACPHCGETFKI